jgi:hypothetical protein
MPSEVSIAKPLSGIETREALIAAFTKLMSRDDRFASHMAYSGFRAKVRLEFYPSQSFIPPTAVDTEIEEGDVSDLSPVATVCEFEMPIKPPNAVRVEAGLPTPVLVIDDKGGSHEKWVKSGQVPKANHIPKSVGK